MALEIFALLGCYTV